MTQIVRQVALLLAAGAIALSAGAQTPGFSGLKLEIGPSTVSGGESARARISVVRDPRDPRVPPEALRFNLTSSPSNLTRFPSSEVTIPPNQSIAEFDVLTAATPVRSLVTILAVLVPASVTKVQAELMLVPALISRVTLNKSTMNGTFGATIECSAELKAPAPAGGIELYLSPVKFSPSAAGVSSEAPLPAQNPRVAAGSRAVTFSIRYQDIVSSYSEAVKRILESQNRTVDLIVALDPPKGAKWVPIPSKAVKTTFNLLPLRITSITVQPASVGGGGEAVATFALNAPPGSNEPVLVSSASASIRLVRLGSSCQAPVDNFIAPVQLQLTPGTTVHSFKVCSGRVTTVTTGDIRVRMRSGDYKTSFTVQP